MNFTVKKTPNFKKNAINVAKSFELIYLKIFGVSLCNMDNEKEKQEKLIEVYKKYKKTGNAKFLSDCIRTGGLNSVKLPNKLAVEIADLLDAAYPLSSKKTLAVDDSWMFYIYWRETEFKTGKKRKNLQKNAIKAVQNWFETRGTPKKYELVRSRLRQEYFIWRDNLSDFELQRYKSSVNQTTGKNHENKI